MPNHPTARRHICKPLTDREVALSNDTANAFLGPKRKPAWLSGNRPSQPTIPPPPCAPQARIELSPAVLPSPAPSDEPSPVFSSVLDSPNASSTFVPGPSVASQTQPAMPPSLPYTTAEFVCASPVMCDPIQSGDGTSQLPTSDASQLPLGRPNVTPSVSIPNLGASGAQAAPGIQRSFTFPLSTNPLGSPVAPPLESQAGSPSVSSRTTTPNGVNHAKRRRLNNNSGSLQLATSIPRISQQRQLITNLASASADLARPRLVLLKDACVRDDIFFVLLHQLFCVHTRSPNEVYQYLNQDVPSGVINGGFRVVEQFLRPNKAMNDQHLDWFTSFPAPLNTILTQMPSYSALLGDVSHFLCLLNMHWEMMLQAMMARKFPFLMEELVAILNCRSPVLQDIIFTSSRRRLEVNDQPFGNDLDSLFKMNRQSRSNEIIEFIPNPTPQVYTRILNRNAHLISSFRETIQRQRQHQFQFQQQAMASAPQHSRVAQQSPPLMQSPTVSFPVPIPSSNTLTPGLVAPQFNPQPGELGVQPPYVQPGQTPTQAQVAPSFAVAGAMGGQLGQQGGTAPPPMQSPLFGQGPFPSNAAQMTYQPPAHDPHQPSNMGQLAPQRRSQTWHQPTSQQQIYQQQTYQQHIQLPFTQPPFEQQPPAVQAQAQAQIMAQWAQVMRQAQLSPPAQPPQAVSIAPRPQVQPSPPAQPPQAVSIAPRPQVQPEAVPNPAQGGLVSPQRPQMQVVNGSGAPRPASRVPAVPSKPQMMADARIFPPRGFRITRSEWPYDLADPKALQMSLHQAHLRSPKRVLRPGAAEGGSEEVQRYYQAVQRFAVSPTPIPPSQYIYRFDFHVDQASFALLETSVTPSGERLPQSNYFQGSLRYRLRCVRKKGSLPEPFHFPEATWITTETTWPSHLGLKLNDDCLTVRRQTHNGKDLPLELTTLIKPGTNSLQVSYPTAVNTMRRSGYILAVEIIETMSHSSVTDLVWNSGLVDAQVTRDAVRSRLAKSSAGAAAASSDDEGLVIVEEGLSIDLADPFSAKIFEVPVRGAGCAHMECFDLENWLQTRPPASKPARCLHKLKPCGCNETPEPSHPDRWKCPVCGEGDARPRSLRVDVFLLEVRQRLAAEGRLGAKAVLVMPDGSWNAVGGDDDGDEGSDGEGAAAASSATAGAGVGAGVNGVARRKSVARATASADRGQHVEVVELLDDD